MFIPEFLCNPFNDPSDPWYYVLGVLFLLIIFGALAAYIFISDKRKKKNDGQATSPDDNARAEMTEPEQTTDGGEAEAPQTKDKSDN